MPNKGSINTVKYFVLPNETTFGIPIPLILASKNASDSNKGLAICLFSVLIATFLLSLIEWPKYTAPKAP